VEVLLETEHKVSKEALKITSWLIVILFMGAAIAKYIAS
jgi:hypothetical protein